MVRTNRPSKPHSKALPRAKPKSKKLEEAKAKAEEEAMTVGSEEEELEEVEEVEEVVVRDDDEEDEEDADDDEYPSEDVDNSQEDLNGISISADRIVSRNSTGFWGGVLTKGSPLILWEIEGSAQMDETDCQGDPDYLEFTLKITNFSIDHRTDPDIAQCVQVRANYSEEEDEEWLTLAFLSGKLPCLSTKVTFSAVDRPVAFRLSSGSGPVTIAGRLISRVNEVAANEAAELKDVIAAQMDNCVAEEGENDDEDDDDDDDEDEEEEEEPQPKSKHIAIRSAVGPMRNQKRSHISPAAVNPPPKKARNGGAVKQK